MLSLIRDKRHYDVEHFVGETSPFFYVFPLQNLHISLQNLHISDFFCTFALAKVLIHGTGRSNPIIRLRTDSRSVG